MFLTLSWTVALGRTDIAGRIGVADDRAYAVVDGQHAVVAPMTVAG
jgi:hypothetical protein